MSISNPEMLFEANADLRTAVRNQLTQTEGVLLHVLTTEGLLFRVQEAKGLTRPVFDTNRAGTVTQHLIGIADTGKTLYALVRASKLDVWERSSTHVFLTEMPARQYEVGRLVHAFMPHSEYAGVQPVDQERLSRMQAMLDGAGNVLLRNDPNMVPGFNNIDGNPVTFSYDTRIEGYEALEVDPGYWAVSAEYVQSLPHDEYFV